ncbi:LytR C-terminal domain-containing protein [Candidatus Roizmanbacteria bacterium]|nr:LytR C-terminal domain-containing protein [Candidatus Roizmanbacteria bacterium]
MQNQEPAFLNSPQKPKNKYPLLIFVAVVVALVGSWLILRQKKEPEKTKVVITKTVTPTQADKPKINKESIKIQVLNGTGTPGQANEAVELLKDAGYSAENIKSTNAEEFNHTSTSIQAKEGFEDVANNIKDALKETFDEIEIDSTNLDKDSEFDIVVTTGGKIFETPTPTASPTQSPTPTTQTTTTPTPTLTLTPTPTPTP